MGINKQKKMVNIQNTLTSVLHAKDYTIMASKDFIGKNEPILKKYVFRALNNTFVEKFIEPNLQDIEYILNILKWSIEFLEIICAGRVFGTIYDKLRWKIVDHTFCIWLGAVAKCDYGIHMSFIGLMVAMYSLSMSISMQFLELPPSMIFREIELNAFRLGLWWATTRNLYYWFNKKITEKYAIGKHRPIDRATKMALYDQMIGTETRRVMKMWRWTIKFLCLNLILRSFEVYIKSVKKNIEEKKKEE